jgi:hypothetical protein
MLRGHLDTALFTLLGTLVKGVVARKRDLGNLLLTALGMHRAKVTTLPYSLAALFTLLGTLGKDVRALGRHGGLLGGRHGGLLGRRHGGGGVDHFPHLVDASLVQLELGDEVGDKLLDFGVHLFCFCLYV